MQAFPRAFGHQPMARFRLHVKPYFLAILAMLVLAKPMFGAVPSIVVDSQTTLQTGFDQPQGVAVAPNNTYYVADANNNRVRAFTSSGTTSTVSTGAYTLVYPAAVAVDAAGDLFIADTPSSGTGRVIEAHATGGVLNGTVTLVVSGGGLQEITAVAIDNDPGSSTFGTLYIGDDITSTLYSVASGTTILTTLSITGLPSGMIPFGMTVDSSGNLYVADANTTVYEIPYGTTGASAVYASGFTIIYPTSVTADGAGNLYILTPLSSSDSADHILEIPDGDWSSGFLVPTTGMALPSSLPSSIAVDSHETLYIPDYYLDNVTGIAYISPVNLSQAAVGTAGPSTQFNYEYNTTVTVGGFQFVTQGDLGTEVSNAGGTCTAGTYSDGNGGGAISPSNPHTCHQNFTAKPSYPGARSAAIQLKGSGTTILASTPVYESGISGATVIYPIATSATVTAGMSDPQSMVISGLNKKIYIADDSHIYSVTGLNGTALTNVSTGSITLSYATGVALNGQGDLYIVDYDLGEVVIVPANTAVSPYAFNPGGLLDHPVAEVFDHSGNLFIGDSGPNGFDSDAGTPGYIVEVPANGGAPFKIDTSSTPVIYPWSLAVNPLNNDLYVVDAGDDETASGAGIDTVSSVGGTFAALGTPSGLNPPIAIVFDAAGEYYVLDWDDDNLGRITAFPPSGSPHVIPYDNTQLPWPWSLAISAGGQSLVAINYVDTGDVNLVYLNGLSSSMNFGTTSVTTDSSTLSATVANIGNASLTTKTPYYRSSNSSAPFTLSGSTTCTDALVLNPLDTCEIDAFFAPTVTGLYSNQFTLETTAYNNGTTKISETGTGD